MSGGLPRLQDALARLVTDGALAHAYERDPGATIVEVAGDTDDGVRAALIGLRSSDVARYARGLRRKRWDDLAATVPLSVRVIGGLAARYQAWLAAHPADAHGVLGPGASEALRALGDLAREIASDPGEAPWAAELLAFEVLAACCRADGVTRSLRARHAIHLIVEELRTGLIPIDPPGDPHDYRFDRGGVRRRRMSR